MNSRDDNLANTGPLNRRFFNWFPTNVAEIVPIGNANSTDQLSIRPLNRVPLYLENVVLTKMFLKNKQNKKRTVVVYVECLCFFNVE